MNCKQISFEDTANSFHVEHVPDDYEEKNLQRVSQCAKNVEQLLRNSHRARLIAETVGAPDGCPPRDFTASFSAIKYTDPPQILISHKVKPIPTYPSIMPSLRWSPYVEVSSASNSVTDLLEDKPKFNCHCENCNMKSCPSRVSTSIVPKTGVFKSNIMTFSDQHTMTPKLNDASCGVGRALSRTSDVCVSSDIAVRDTETYTHAPPLRAYQQCAPIPILKKYDYEEPCAYNHCGHDTGHVPGGVRQEAVRDTDMGEDYCEPIKPRSFKNFFKSKRKPVVDSPHCTHVPEYGRKIIYNEGISDLVARGRLTPARVPSPVNVGLECSRTYVKPKTKSFVESHSNLIPFGHTGESKYHHHCRRPVQKHIYRVNDDDEEARVMENQTMVRKTLPSKSVRKGSPLICLPRKMLTSEAHIDAYIESHHESLVSDVSHRRKKNRNYM